MISVDRVLEKVDIPAKVFALARFGSSEIIGWNSDKTSPRYCRHYDTGHVLYTRHAEFHVLDQLPHTIDGSRVVLYVLRISCGGVSMAKPCWFCQMALKARGILPRNINYTDWDGSWKKMVDWTSELKEPFVKRCVNV